MRRVRWLILPAVIGLGLWWWLRPAAPPPAELSPLSLTRQAEARIGGRPGPVSAGAIPDADLPPAGTRSLFDHHVARLGALPYPYAALLDSFKPLDRWGLGSVSLLIPHGRSLAKGHTDDARPRVLSAVQLDPPEDPESIAPIYSGRLFLGLSEAIDTIEIIAYNEAAGRFEFQLVKDYCAGCTPRIVYAKRAICTACHQAGDPIFAVRPWQETNAHRAVAEGIAGARGVSWPEASRSLYHGVPLSTQIVMPESFDELVGTAGRLSLAQRIWLDGCGETGLACRRALLAEALSLLIEPGAFNPAAATTQALLEQQRASWPAAGIAVPDNRLPDRLPPSSPGFYAELLDHLRALWPGQTQDTANHDSAARLAHFERLPRLPVALDPLTPRAPLQTLSADTLAGVHAVAALFSPHDRPLLQALSDDAPQRLREAILSGAADAVLGPAPLNRVAILQQLHRAFGRPAPAYCCLDTGGFSPPVSESTAPLSIAADSSLAPFQRYCFGCHRGNPVQRLDFMSGDSEAEVLAAIRARPQILDVLDYARYADTERRFQLMPPPRSDQRALLDAARANRTGELERMRETAAAPESRP